jgi:3-oxoadipate enol-lactonase
MATAARTVNVGGLRLAVEDHGDGLPLVLLHGFPLSSEIFAPIRPALETVARVITPDLPGFGGSDQLAGAYTMDALAQQVVELADALSLPRFVLGGHSMGGYVALRVAAAHAERLEALILVATRAMADAPEARERRNEAIAAIVGGRRETFVDAFVAKLVGESTRRRAPRLVEELRTLAATVPDEVLIAALEAMRDRPDSSPILGALHLPVLVLAGSEDELIPPEAVRHMAALLPDAQLAFVPLAGHTPTVERPVAAAEVMVSFLEQLQQRRARG